MLNQNFTDHDYNGFFISQKEDGYVNLTHMAKAHGKNMHDWTRLKETKDLIKTVNKELNLDWQIPLSGSIYSVRGGNDKKAQGTWGHPLIAISFAMWLSTEFHFWSLKHLFCLMLKGSTALSVEDLGRLEAYKRLEEKGLAGTGLVLNNEYVYTKDGVVYTDSQRMATQFGLKHCYVLKRIETRIAALIKSGVDTEDYQKVEYLDRNRKLKYEYILNSCGYHAVASRFNRDSHAMVNKRFSQEFKKLTKNVEEYAASYFFSTKKLKDKEAQSVYAMLNPLTSQIKIGISAEIPKRMNSLEKTNCTDLVLLFESPICSNAGVLESLAHKHFKEFNTFGEYFLIKRDEAVEFLEKQKYYMSGECERADTKVLVAKTL